MIKTKALNISKENILGVILLIFLFLPHTNFLFQIINPLLITYLSYKYAAINKKFSIKYILILLLFISFVINMFTFDLELKSIFRVIVLIQMLLFFPFVRNIKIKNSFLYFSLIFILITQSSYLLNISSVISFIDNYYPIDEEYYWLQSDHYLSNSSSINDLFSGISLRYGGIFRNANQCMRYVSLLLVVFLIENRDIKLSKIIPFILITLLSAILAGSRTGFVVISLIVFTYFYLNRKRLSVVYKRLIIVFSILIFIFIVFNIDTLLNFRMFKVSEGLDDSFGVKTNIFTDYLSKLSNPFFLLFGNFDSSLLSLYNPTFPMMDSEYGDLIFQFGFLFTTFLIIFYIQVFKRMNKSNRIFFLIFLWMLTSTVLLSYRMSFLFMFFLSKYTYEFNSNKSLNK